MIVVEHNKIELDYCTNCKGVWFDNAELDLLLRSMDIAEKKLLQEKMLHYPEVNIAEKKRKCPICDRKMKKINIGEGKDLIIDTCDRRHGLWFDGGEVIQLIKQVAAKREGAPGHNHVLSFMGEVFQV
jgi:uncharacterized protein